MWFSQLSIFKLGVLQPGINVSDALAKRKFTPCNKLDWFSEGFAPVAPVIAGDTQVLRYTDKLLMRLIREDKLLPSGVVRVELDKKVAAIEAAEHRKVGSKEKLQLKEQITDDLLPRAFTRLTSILAYIDRGRRFVMIDSASNSKAENLVSCLREAMPPFPCRHVRTVKPAEAAMTDWLLAGEAPGSFELDADAKLADSSEHGGVVTIRRMDLTTDEIRQHIEAGKQVVELGLVWDGKIRFVLTDGLQLKRVQFLDVLQEEARRAGDDLASLLGVTFTLMSMKLGELVDELFDHLGGVVEDEQ